MSRIRKQEKPDLMCKRLSFNGEMGENSKSDGGDILNTKWKVFRVSPLYNFDKKKLNLYESRLCDEMNSTNGVISNVIYKCRFILNERIKLNNQSHETLQIKITNNQGQVVYEAYFIPGECIKENLRGCISLPILLVKGKVHEMPLVHTILSKTFDCDIQSVTFSFYALITFFVKMLETPRKNNGDIDKEVLTLEYKVPGCEIKDNIKVTLGLYDTTFVLAVIMERLHERNQEISNKEVIWQFYNKILHHLYNAFLMDLSFAELHKVTFPDGQLNVEGEIKVSTDDASISALSVLQCFVPLNAVTSI